MTDFSAVGRRRAAVVAAVCGAVLLGACTPSTGPADPTQSPTSAAPARSVTTANLLTVDDMPNEDPMTKEVVEAADKAGRPVSESYICLPTNGLGSLGATSMVTRDFTYKIINADSDPYPDSPLKNKPSIYTQALQFPDEATATAARTTYAGWIKNCAATLTERGYLIDTDQSLKLSTLKVEGAKAQAGMTAYVKPDAKDTEDLYWESAAVTQVKDRLMIVVTISWGMDSPGTFDTSDGDFIHPVVALTEPSAERLAA
ncbi:MAG: hypothetical protein QM650_07185 [Microlunatus sp.]